MGSFRLLILDYDGTLADSGQWFADNINRFAARHGFRSVAPEEIETLRAMPTREVIRHLKVRPWRLPSIARDMRRAVAEPGGTPSLFPGVPEFLDRVKQAGITVAVVSSNTEANIRVGLGEANAAKVDAFDCGASLFGKAGKLRRLARRLTPNAPVVEAVLGGDGALRDARNDAQRSTALTAAPRVPG